MVVNLPSRTMISPLMIDKSTNPMEGVHSTRAATGSLHSRHTVAPLPWLSLAWQLK